ncbi:receptor-type tyrosine-protein phosphatase F-like isoform X2 [Dysidea avara]|uniref:receptor-type tyrosine-protein phosphatase F-like isoform X2 n=1 Tax=Dysidea avara TaxID=196820 RepID=UPI00331C063D
MIAKLIVALLLVLAAIANANAATLMITEGPANLTVIEGQNARFTCVASSDGNFTILWLKNDREHKRTHHWQVNSSELLIVGMREREDKATITCVVEDEDKNTVTSTAYLTVISTLDVTVSIEGVQSNEAAVNYSYNVPLPSELSLFVTYGEELRDDIQQRRNLTSLSGRVTLNGLKPFTSYTIQLSVMSDNGASLNSSSKTFKTLAAAPDTTVIITNYTAVNSSELFLQWMVTDTDTLNGDITGYEVVYTYSDQDGDMVKSILVNSTVTDVMFRLGGLTPYTNYTIVVRVVNIAGEGPLGGTVSLMTAEGVPTEVRNLTTDMKNATSVMIMWDPPINFNGIFEYYKVIVNEIEYMPRYPSHLIHNLTYFTQYNITVAPKTGGGLGPKVSTQVMSGEGPPSSPPTLNVSSVSSHVIQVKWESPPKESLNGKLNSFIIQWRSQDDVYNKTVSSEDRSHNITGLTPYTEYNISIAAMTVAPGPFSDETMFKTPEFSPSPVRHIEPIAINSSSINITWNVPAEPNGIVSYHVIVVSHKSFNTSDTFLVINGLKPFTKYYIHVQPYTRAGFGDKSTGYSATTLESTPSAPTNVRTTTILPTEISITWGPPNNPNGAITVYSVKCGSSQQPVNSSLPHYTCMRLQPGVLHTVSVTGYTIAGPGETVSVQQQTPCDIPTFTAEVGTESASLEVISSQCSAHESHQYLVIVQQVILNDSGAVLDPLKSLDAYTLQELIDSTRSVRENLSNNRTKRQDSYTPVSAYIAAMISSADFNNDGFVVGDGREYGGYENYPLGADKDYEIAVALMQAQGQELHFSTPTIISTEPRKDDSSEDDEMLLFIIIAAVAAVIVVIILTAIILLICCMMCGSKHPQEKKEKEELGAFERAGSLRSSINSLQLDRTVSTRSSKKKKLVDPIEQRRSIIQMPELESHPPIPVDGFLHKLSVLEECERQLFIEEFASLMDSSGEFTIDNSMLDYNFAKNRYNNILPYDHSRVKLSAVKHVPGSDYINASYCDGHMKHRGYIATQGPLVSTVADFWRMMWEQRSSVIVMLTRLEEGDRPKCHQYWPERGESATTFGGVIQVKLLDSTYFADYAIRIFRLSKLGSPNEVRTVTQFHFISWPDHGVPNVTTTMLMFVRRVQLHCMALPEDTGPTVVHCSAGVGRTGCYIVIDSALHRLREGQTTIDIYGHVNLLRSQRPYMVQHEEQYFFTYEAVAEAIVCGDTERTAVELPDHVEKLNQITDGSSRLEEEFKRLALEKADPQQLLAAKKPANKEKNRYVNVLPYETSRVVLKAIPGEDCSDYINGSYINGYFSKNMFIAAQSPLPVTVIDFWRMLWERRSPIVVMVMERGVERYWPVDRIKDYGDLSVEPTTERHSADYTYREFKLTDYISKETHVVRHFQFLGWPEVGVPSSGLPLIDLMEEVNKMYRSLKTTDPITVHCKAGVAVTGVFVALRVLLDQLKIEGTANVFQAVKVLRIQRAAMVQTMEQYRFLYDALVEYVGSDLFNRNGPSPAPAHSHSKLPYYGSEVLISAHTFSSSDVDYMQHSNV